MPLPFLEKEINISELVSGLSVQQFRWLVAGFSIQKPEFNPRKVHAESVIDKVAVRQVSVSVLEFRFPVIIRPMPHSNIYHQKLAQ